MNKRKIDQGLEHESIQGKNVRQAKAKFSSKATRFKESLRTRSAKLKPFKVVSKYCEVLFNRIDKILDAEREWRQYRSDVLNGTQSQESAARYVRVNIDLKSGPPHLDEKKKLKQLQNNTKEALGTPECRFLIDNIACSLIVSSFYFIKGDLFEYDDISKLSKCTGKIACRFDALPVANDPKVVTPSDAPVGDLAKSDTKDSRKSPSPNNAEDNTSLNAATPLQTKPSRLSSFTHRSSPRGGVPRPSTDTEAFSPSRTPETRGTLSSAAAAVEKSPLAADEKQVSVDVLRWQSQDMLKATAVHAEQVMPSDGSSTTDENTSDDSEEDRNIQDGRRCSPTGSFS